MKTMIMALAALLLAGCEGILELPKQGQAAPAAGGRAIIRIGDGDGAARSLVPVTPPEFTKYELAFTAEGKNSVFRTLTSTLISLNEEI